MGEPATERRLFDHEKLDVYRVAQDFIRWRRDVLRRAPRGSDLADQLTRAATSMVLNIAEGAGEFSLGDRARFYRMARRSAMECGAILEVMRALNLEPESKLDDGRTMLERVVSMLSVLTRTHPAA